ncbi:hypothetical protein KBD45_08445 [Candidatus Dojkabacteria bacterium]|nr:hypothetical protein [Candidatus Dojkabacteria bacterium]
MFSPIGSEMIESPVNNTGLSEEKLDEMIEQTKQIRDTLDFSDCYGDLTNNTNNSNIFMKPLSVSEQDTIKFAVWYFMYQAFDRFDEIIKHKPITEDEIEELDVCLYDGKDAVSILSRYPEEENYKYLVDKYTKKLKKMKAKFLKKG